MQSKLATHLSIVTHYGNKDKDLADQITMIQNKLSGLLGPLFRPYEMMQVHGTIIGLEGVITNEGILNYWFRENLGENRLFRPDRFLEFIRSDRIADTEIKIGGWHPDRDYEFTSRNQHPFIRSFSIQGEFAVAMGWPFRNGQYGEELYLLRKSFEDINVLHKWHKAGYQDNDFFFVTGRIDGNPDPSTLEKAAAEVRRILSENGTKITIGKSTISIAAYVDPQLPPETTRAFAMKDPLLTPELIHELYHQDVSN